MVRAHLSLRFLHNSRRIFVVSECDELGMSEVVGAPVHSKNWIRATSSGTTQTQSFYVSRSRFYADLLPSPYSLVIHAARHCRDPLRRLSREHPAARGVRTGPADRCQVSALWCIQPLPPFRGVPGAVLPPAIKKPARTADGRIR
jgi:hypothetical protein